MKVKKFFRLITIVLLYLLLVTASSAGIVYLVRDEEIRANVKALGEQLSSAFSNEETIEEEVEPIEEVDAPEITIELSGTPSEEAISATKERLAKVPVNVRKSFVENGWKIVITDKNLVVKFNFETERVTGVTESSSSTIWIAGDETGDCAIVHEFGHYIDKKLSYPSESIEFARIWVEEFDAFKKYHYTHADNITSSNQYFAEAYEMAILDPEGMKEACPKTYEYLIECSNRL